MRALIVLLAALLLPLSGCLGGVDEDQSDDTPDPTPEENTDYALPEDFSASGMVPVGASWNCIQPCPEYPFSLEGRTVVEVLLEWTIPANDVDLFIYDASGNVVGESVDIPPQTSEHIRVTLGPGDYVISVEPYTTTPDPFTVTATFGYP